MDFIYDALWLWLALSAAAMVLSNRKPRIRPYGEPLLGITGLLFIASLILHMLPRLQ